MFSIIVPVFNAQRTIEVAVESILRQSFEDFEVLLIDDSSTDNSRAVIEGIAKRDRRVRVMSNIYEKGAAGARNTGTFYSNRRYIAFLDSDDVWVRNKLEIQSSVFQKEFCDVTYSSYFVFDDDGVVGEKCFGPRGDSRVFCPPKSLDFDRLKKTCDIGCSTLAYDSERIGKWYFPDMAKEDYCLWLLMASSGLKFLRSPGVLAYYRRSKSSVSGNKAKEVFKQYAALRVCGDLGIPESIYCLIFYALKGLVKYR